MKYFLVSPPPGYSGQTGMKKPEPFVRTEHELDENTRTGFEKQGFTIEPCSETGEVKEKDKKPPAPNLNSDKTESKIKKVLDFLLEYFGNPFATSDPKQKRAKELAVLPQADLRKIAGGHGFKGQMVTAEKFVAFIIEEEFPEEKVVPNLSPEKSSAGDDKTGSEKTASASGAITTDSGKDDGGKE